MLLALLVLSTAGVLASCVKPSTSSSAPAPSTSSAPAPSTSSSAPAPSTSNSSSVAPSTSSSSPVVATPSFEIPTYLEYENVSNWEIGTINANKIFNGETVTVFASSSKTWTIQEHNKTAEDGTVFTKRLKSDGKTTSDGRYIQVETSGTAKLVFYAISGKETETRNITVVKDWANVKDVLPEEGIVTTLGIVGDKVARYEVELTDAATYTLHLGAAINFYSFELIDSSAATKEVEIASLKVVGPEEYRVGGTFDPSKYAVYGVSEDGKYEHLLESSEYTLGTIDTTVEKTGENALDLEAKYVGFESIKGACEIEVWNWYGINVAEDLKALFVVGGGATEFKNGSDIKFTANNPGNILKSVTLTVGGQPKDVTIEDGEFTVEGANGDINLTAATWEAEIVDSGLTNISWKAETALAADWATLKNTAIADGTMFGDFKYVDLAADNTDDKYAKSDTPSIQLASKGRNQLQFATNGASVVTLKFSGTGSDKTGVTVELHKADGTLVVTSDPMDGSSAVEATFNITEAGSYYVCAGQSQHIRLYEISCEQTA